MILKPQTKVTPQDLTQAEMMMLVRKYLREKKAKIYDQEDFTQEMWVAILTKNEKKQFQFTDKNHLMNWVKCVIDWEFRTRVRNYKIKKLETSELNDVVINTTAAEKKDDRIDDLISYVETQFNPTLASIFKMHAQGATLAMIGEAHGLSLQWIHIKLNELTEKLQKVFGNEQTRSY